MSLLKKASPDHPIHELFVKRWSPYAFSDQAVPEEDLRALFEAARWSASNFNEQPWRYIVATRKEPEEFERLLSCLDELNQPWAKTAPVLALGCAALKFARNGQPNTTAEHDLGAASTYLSMEATNRGLSVHQMAGILPDRAREVYRIPDGFRPLTALAIGYVGNPNTLPGKYKEVDLRPRQRKSPSEFVFGGQWGTTSDVVK
jgi:nitroreductase